MIEAPRRILILKPCCLGDVLLATPLAAALAAAWPAAHIDWAVGAHSRPALAGNPHVTELVDATGCIRGELRPAALLRLVRAIRRGRYDAVFVPDRAPLLALIPFLARVPLRVGLDSAGRGRWHTVRVPVPALRHEAELYLDLARAVGIPPPPPRPLFVPSDADRVAARAALGIPPPDSLSSALSTASTLSTLSPPPTPPPTHPHAPPRIVIHPGGGVNPGMALLSKRWPAERFAALMDRLVEERGAELVLLGGQVDEAAVAAVLAAARPATLARTVNLSGQLALGEVAAVIEACALYIGNDSGIAHLAAAVGTPVVVIFGPTRPERYGPLPGSGVAVAPEVSGVLGGDRLATGAVDRLGEAVGSAAIEGVAVEAVWAACGGVLGAGGRQGL